MCGRLTYNMINTKTGNITTDLGDHENLFLFLSLEEPTTFGSHGLRNFIWKPVTIFQKTDQMHHGSSIVT